MLAPTIGHYVLARDDGQPLDFLPGQFIQIHFDYADGTPARRSYSLATIHDHAMGPGEAVEIAVSHVPGGAATALFEALEIGSRVSASGPYGRFCLMPGDRNARYLLIGTGTGVTPYRSMLPVLASQIAERGIEVVLLAGARTPGELLYADDFRAFADAHPQFRYVPCLSRELPEAGSPHAHADVRHGYVQQQLPGFPFLFTHQRPPLHQRLHLRHPNPAPDNYGRQGHSRPLRCRIHCYGPLSYPSVRTHREGTYSSE